MTAVFLRRLRADAELHEIYSGTLVIIGTSILRDLRISPKEDNTPQAKRICPFVPEEHQNTPGVDASDDFGSGEYRDAGAQSRNNSRF